MIIGAWVYCVISGIIFIWLSKHFVMEKKETGEELLIGESKRATVIGAIIAIEWVIAVPIFILPMLKKGE